MTQLPSPLHRRQGAGRLATVVFGATLLVLTGLGCNRKAPEPGFLSIAIHDAPPDPNVSQLMVRIAKVRVREAGTANWIDLPANPAPFDLLTLQNGRFVDVLVQAQFPSGNYDELRLILKDDPVATVDGKQYTVKSPSCDTSGCKLKGLFTISPNQCTKLSVDFDAKQSIKANPQHGFVLEPVLRLDGALVGACSGEPVRTPEETWEAFRSAWRDGDLNALLATCAPVPKTQDRCRRFFSTLQTAGLVSRYAATLGNIALVDDRGDLRIYEETPLDKPDEPEELSFRLFSDVGWKIWEF